MKKNHPEIHVLYIPASCTSIYQLVDDILGRSFKHAFCQEFNKYTLNNITIQVKAEEEVVMDFKIKTLKPNICDWLYKAWLNVVCQVDMVTKGWKQIGLLRSYESGFKKKTILENMKNSFFKTS